MGRRVAVTIALGLVALMEPARAAPTIGGASVVGGSLDSADPAVALVFIYRDGFVVGICSGTLISPTVVLTAAHCVDVTGAEIAFSVYFGSTVWALDDYFIEEIEVIDSAFYPDWSLLRGDIGLLRLERAASTAPVEINRAPLGEERVGDSLRVVGWGETDRGVGDAGVKRTAPIVLTGLDSAYYFNYGTSATNICAGDSGGPALIEVDGVEVVAGINSFSTLGTCRDEAGATRVAANATWIDGWLQRWSVEPGSRGLDDACNTHLDCTTGFCPVIDGERSCQIRCDVDADSCPAGTECARLTQATGVCAEPSPGGCSASRPTGILFGLLIVVAMARRRRRS